MEYLADELGVEQFQRMKIEMEMDILTANKKNDLLLSSIAHIITNPNII